MAKRKRRNVPVGRTPKKEKTGIGKYFIFFFVFIICAAAAYYYFVMYESRPEPQEPVAVSEAPKEKVIKVEVLNGCGVPKLARQAEDYLRGEGFDVVKTDNARSFDFPETIVIARDTVVTYANRVAKALFVENNVIQQINRDLLLDVTVILGKDYKKLAFISPKKEGQP